jgi:hypothetical protein
MDIGATVEVYLAMTNWLASGAIAMVEGWSAISIFPNPP